MRLIQVVTFGISLPGAAQGFLVASPSNGIALARPGAFGRRMDVALRMGGEERKLTNQECELLGLPNGSTLLGEMSEMMERKLTVKVECACLGFHGRDPFLAKLSVRSQHFELLQNTAGKVRGHQRAAVLWQ